MRRADYRLCKVLSVEKDKKGLVRTAVVGMRPKDSREKSLPYTSKKLSELDVSVQRLVMVCPSENVPTEKDVLSEGVPAFKGAPTKDISPEEWWRCIQEIVRDDNSEYVPAQKKPVPAQKKPVPVLSLIHI